MKTKIEVSDLGDRLYDEDANLRDRVDDIMLRNMLSEN